MKWQGRRKSDNVRRGGGGPATIGVGGLVLMLIIYLIGGNPMQVLEQTAGGGQNPGPPTERDEFLSVVLADTEDVWNEIFRENNMDYVEPQLNLYSSVVNSGCGRATSQVGPFYCPLDNVVYIDTSFYDDLTNKFGASGDFAFAYVLAHEVGHHVQNQLGILGKVQSLRGRVSETEYNKYSVALELQADYYGGVFAHYVQNKGYLEEGDIEEALNAASAIGDDKIQEMATGEVRPDTFTHGSSEQRVKWFYEGLKYGDLQHGDTFSALQNGTL